MEPRWTSREAAQFLGVSVDQLRRLGVPRVELRRHPGARPLVRYDPDEVRAWWAAQVERSRRTAPTLAPRPVALRAYRPPQRRAS